VVDGTWTGEERWVLPQELTQLGGIAPKVELVKVELHAEGVDDVGFIRGAQLRTHIDPAASPVEITGRPTVDPRMLLFVPEKPVDLTSALETGAVQMLAEISARLPQHPWTLAVNACYRAGGTFEWRP
jgi:hypothetical protein